MTFFEIFLNADGTANVKTLLLHSFEPISAKLYEDIDNHEGIQAINLSWLYANK